mmetsp:Transcript_70281/g.215315  ORF Transcript_70281/g.215315 Transcript_70281/m.215315 type:complete len:208 (-) Transcript_70281:39-662(-)
MIQSQDSRTTNAMSTFAPAMTNVTNTRSIPNLNMTAPEKPDRLHTSSTKSTIAWYSRVIIGQPPERSAACDRIRSRKRQILSKLNFQTTINTAQEMTTMICSTSKIRNISGPPCTLRSWAAMISDRTSRKPVTLDFMNQRNVPPEAVCNSACTAASNASLRTIRETLRMSGMYDNSLAAIMTRTSLATLAERRLCASQTQYSPTKAL